jgi:DNA-binding GntR family transcriptional regulator
VELARISGNPFLLKAVRGAMRRLSHVRCLEVLSAGSRARAWDQRRLSIDLLHRRAADDAAREAAAHTRAMFDRLLLAIAGQTA